MRPGTVMTCGSLHQTGQGPQPRCSHPSFLPGGLPELREPLLRVPHVERGEAVPQMSHLADIDYDGDLVPVQHLLIGERACRQPRCIFMPPDAFQKGKCARTQFTATRWCFWVGPRLSENANALEALLVRGSSLPPPPPRLAHGGQ